LKCINCGRERAQEEGRVVKLDDEAREMIKTLTKETAPEDFFYCAPCYRVITDREMGARLISGWFEMQLRVAGHPRAAQAAEAVYKFLIEKSARKQVS
jgi:hypothetical protein